MKTTLVSFATNRQDYVQGPREDVVRSVVPDHAVTSCRVRMFNMKLNPIRPFPDKREIVQQLAATYQPGRDQFEWVTDAIWRIKDARVKAAAEREGRSKK